MTVREFSERPPGARRRARRVLAVFLIGSVVVHAAMIVVLPQFSSDREVPTVRVLEVALVQSGPLPVAPAEPAPAPTPPQRVARAPVPPQPQRMTDAPPVLALPESRTQSEPSFTVPAPRPAETRSAPAEAKTEVASVAVTPPSFSAAYLRNPAPRYPLAARRAGEQGTVTLRVLVTRDGQPARVSVEKSSGSTHLDEAALEAVKTWRFTPARQGAEPVESWMLVPVVFRLEGAS